MTSSYHTIAVAAVSTFVPQTPEEKQATVAAMRALSSEYATLYGKMCAYSSMPETRETVMEHNVVTSDMGKTIIQAEKLVKAKKVSVVSLLGLINTAEEKLTNDTSDAFTTHMSMHELWTKVLQKMTAKIAGLTPTAENVQSAIEATKYILKQDANANQGKNGRPAWKHLFDLAIRAALTRDDSTHRVAAGRHSVLDFSISTTLFTQSLTAKVVEHCMMELDTEGYFEQMKIWSEWKTHAVVQANVEVTALVHACAEECSTRKKFD